ncbi:flagellar hook-associated protein FlgL [Paenibacillus alkalitolerans]|uniref:flagellar hook-associated protein FlgL n=1 Tax=Paenibacillus alkalitolerans TaxID=2799335 RepID=UPI001F2EBFE4|nr:flagellar hook-associated protein FlgL [Paenibacillus alkalitolerans]
MPSRVTQNMMNSQLLRNLNNNMRRMDDLQNQLASGRRINKPSDDPVGISYSMRYRSELSANDQFEKNVDSANSWLDYTDTMLNQAGEVFQRARELAVQGANGTNPQTALNAIKSEVEQLYQQMVKIGNSEYNGKYVFNGQLTDVAPYTEAAAMSQSSDNVDIRFEISPGVTMPVSVTGNQVFGTPSETDNTFRVLQDLITALGSGNQAGVNNAIGKLDTRLDKFLEVRAEIGARSNRLQLAEQRLKDIGINLQTLKSKTEDADMAEVITNLKMSENIYQSSLSAGSRLIRPSLIDFLR